MRFPISMALWHFARGVTQAAQSNLDDARAELFAFRAAVAAVPKDAQVGHNATHALLGIAEQMLTGEILDREGKSGLALDALRGAVRHEEQLRSLEPTEWLPWLRLSVGSDGRTPSVSFTKG